MLKWVSALVLVGLAACAVGPDYRRPELDLPAQWYKEVGDGWRGAKVNDSADGDIVRETPESAS